MKIQGISTHTRQQLMLQESQNKQTEIIPVKAERLPKVVFNCLWAGGRSESWYSKEAAGENKNEKPKLQIRHLAFHSKAVEMMAFRPVRNKLRQLYRVCYREMKQQTLLNVKWFCAVRQYININAHEELSGWYSGAFILAE